MSGRKLTVELDSEIRITPGERGLDVRVFRRSVSDVSADAFKATAWGFQVPVHRAGDLAEAIRDVAAGMAAPAGQG